MTVRGALAAVLLLILVPAPAQAAPIALPTVAPGASDVRWSVRPSSAKGPDGRDFIIRP